MAASVLSCVCGRSGRLTQALGIICVKSYFLEHVSSIAAAESALRKELPGQERPWLLRTTDGDVIAYFNVAPDLDGAPNLNVQADISGRHFNEDAPVVDVLQRLRASVGGVVTNDA